MSLNGRILKLTLMLGLVLIIGNFSNRVEAVVPQTTVASIENSAEPYIYKLDAEMNEDKDIVAFVKRVYDNGKILKGQTQRFPLGLMKMGVLVEKLGFKVLKYDPSKFTSHKGGVITIYYARNFFMSKFTSSAYGKFELEFLRNGDTWQLFDTDGKEINYLYFKIKKNFFGIPKGITHVRFDYRKNDSLKTRSLYEK